MVEIRYDEMSTEDRQAMQEEVATRFFNVMSLIGEYLRIPSHDLDLDSDIPPSELLRRAERLSAEGATEDDRREAEKLTRHAALRRVTIAMAAEARAIKRLSAGITQKYTAIRLRKAIEQRQEARQAGDVDTLRELNRERHRAGGRGRKKK